MVCAYCRGDGATVLEFREIGQVEPDTVTVCAGCLFVALMRLEGSLESGELVLVGEAQGEPPTP